MLDLRQLSYFVSVAEKKSFTKAAADHYIAQASISQQIRSLENQLGVKLLDRNNRSVELTPAGQVLLVKAKRLLSETKEIAESAQRAAKGFEGTLRIGFEGPHEKRFLPKLIEIFCTTYPHVRFIMNDSNISNLKDSLENGDLDIIFNISSYLKGYSDLKIERIHRDSLYIFMPHDHPLATNNLLHVSMLADEKFLGLDSWFTQNDPVNLLAQDGIVPKISYYTSSIVGLFVLVEAKFGITPPLPKGLEIYASNNIKAVPIDVETEDLDLVVAWRRDNINPVIPLFIKTMRENAESLGLNLLTNE
ncbi:MAG: LysR family transcriptional regulator [Anaerovoracaceae bacterium]|jgi:DNA-binding transcriptional LysR family regulator